MSLSKHFHLFLNPSFYFILLIIFLPTQLGLHFWPDYTRILGLRIDYLAPTIYLTDILSILLLVSWTISNHERINTVMLNLFQHPRNHSAGPETSSGRQGIQSHFNKIFLISLFTLVVFLNTLFSSHPLISLYQWLRILQLILLALYVRHHSAFAFKTLKTILPYQLFFLSLLAIAQILFEKSLGGPFWLLGERTFSISTPGIAKTEFLGNLTLRPYATFSHPNSLAGYLLICLILIIFLNKKNKSMIHNSLFILPFLALFLTFSRTVWIASILIALIWLNKKLTPIIVFLALTISLTLPLFLILFHNQLPLTPDFQLRLQLSQISWRMFLDHSWLGVGLGNFIPSLPSYLHSPTISLLQPVHNAFWLIGSELGLIGLIGLMWLLIKFISKPSILYPLSSILLIAILITASTDHYWLTLPQNRLLLAIIIGLL